MGECGCGQYDASVFRELPDGTLLTMGLYRGCEYCDSLIAATLYAFPPGVEFEPEERQRAQPLIPDEYGGYGDGSWPPAIPVLEVDALVEVLRPYSEEAAAVFEEDGLHLIQEAIRLTWRRIEKQQQEYQERVRRQKGGK